MSEEAAYHEGLLVTANMLDYRVPTTSGFAAESRWALSMTLLRVLVHSM